MGPLLPGNAESCVSNFEVEADYDTGKEVVMCF